MNEQKWKDIRYTYDRGKSSSQHGKSYFDMVLAEAILDLDERIKKLEELKR